MNLRPDKTEFTDLEHLQIRKDVEAAKLRDGLAEAEIARQSEVPSSTLNQYLKGRYAGDDNGPATKLFKWLEDRRRRAEAAMRAPRAPGYLELRTATRFMAILGYARECGRLVSICGEPGVSKTSVARQYVHTTPRAWLCTMEPSTRGVPTMLVEMLNAMGDPDAKGTPQALSRRVCQKAQEAKCLIIIDEAQHLSDQAIEQLRAINDRVRCGIALLGNMSAYAKTAHNGQRAAFAQVSSRIAQREYIIKPDPADAAAFATAWASANGEELGRKEIEFLQTVAAKPGGLRNIEMTMEAALMAAWGSERPVDVDLLQAAYAHQAGLSFAA
jgi:DNA transposition AAA+ family ATPase